MFTFGAKPNPKIKIAQREIRTEKAPPVKKPTPLPSKLASRAAQQTRESAQTLHTKPRASPATSNRLDPNSGKRKAVRQKSPAQQVFSSSSDDDSDSPASSHIYSEKRQKSGTPVDLKRQLRAERPFSTKDGEVLIHAADVANENEQAISVYLQYPAAALKER